MLVTRIFSFSHVFPSFISLVHQKVALCGNGLRSPCKESTCKEERKGEIWRTGTRFKQIMAVCFKKEQ